VPEEEEEEEGGGAAQGGGQLRAGPARGGRRAGGVGYRDGEGASGASAERGVLETLATPLCAAATGLPCCYRMAVGRKQMK